MKQLYVISAVAKDKPGLVHAISNVLGNLHINIIDIDARSVRGHFLMFLVIDLATSEHSYEEMMAHLEPVRSHFELGLRVEPYKEGRRVARKKLMMLTIMGIDRPGIVGALSGICAENAVNIESIKMIARGEYIAIEILVDTSGLEDLPNFKKTLFSYADDSGLDVSLRDENIFRKPRRVVVFDCDSTIIRAEVIDELARFAGVGDDVEKVTAKAMNGEIDFKCAIQERIRLLQGMTTEQLELIANSIQLTRGAEELVSTLRFMGYKVGVISGGFTFFTDHLKRRLNLDYVFANELEIRDGIVTGNIKGDIVDAERKGEILELIAEREGISVDQIVAVGDGANDRFMLANAGLAIGFSPKEILKNYSDGMITSDNISGLLYFMGIPDTELEKIKTGAIPECVIPDKDARDS